MQTWVFLGLKKVYFEVIMERWVLFLYFIVKSDNLVSLKQQVE